MPAPSAQRPRCGDVPEEDLLVAADGGEACVVAGYGEVEHLVAVGAVGLDQAGGGGCWGSFLGVVEVDAAVGGAGEDLWFWGGNWLEGRAKGGGGCCGWVGERKRTYWPRPAENVMAWIGPW